MSDTPAAREQRAAKTRRGEGHSTPFHVFKPGRGSYVRWSTAAGIGILIAWGLYWLNSQLTTTIESLPLRTGIVVAIGLVLFYLLFRYVGQKEKTVNFLIDTEGEMKKVNWSTWQEVKGATAVVIVTVLILSLILFVVDIIFMMFFSGINVLQIDIWERIFGSGDTP